MDARAIARLQSLGRHALGAGLVATLRARDGAPSFAVPAVTVLAGGSLVLGAWLQSAVD